MLHIFILHFVAIVPNIPRCWVRATVIHAPYLRAERGFSVLVVHTHGVIVAPEHLQWILDRFILSKLCTFHLEMITCTILLKYIYLMSQKPAVLTLVCWHFISSASFLTPCFTCCKEYSKAQNIRHKWVTLSQQLLSPISIGPSKRHSVCLSFFNLWKPHSEVGLIMCRESAVWRISCWSCGVFVQ